MKARRTVAFNRYQSFSRCAGHLCHSIFTFSAWSTRAYTLIWVIELTGSAIQRLKLRTRMAWIFECIFVDLHVYIIEDMDRRCSFFWVIDVEKKLLFLL